MNLSWLTKPTFQYNLRQEDIIMTETVLDIQTLPDVIFSKISTKKGKVSVKRSGLAVSKLEQSFPEKYISAL